MKRDKIELKPCPFCGQDSAGFANAGFGFIVKCRKCGTKTDIQNTTEEAAAFWNERKPLWKSIPGNSIEFLVKFTRTLADVLVENKRLREALENIKDKAELEESKASNATYGFAYDVETLAREALKGGKEC